MGKFGDAMKSLPVVIEPFPSSASEPYLVQTITASNPPSLMKGAAPLIAQGWEVVSTLGLSGTVYSNMVGMALRMPNPEYGQLAA